MLPTIDTELVILIVLCLLARAEKREEKQQTSQETRPVYVNAPEKAKEENATVTAYYDPNAIVYEDEVTKSDY